MSFDDGVKYVDITTDQERFEGLTTDEMQKEAKRVIKENFVGKVIGVNNRVFVNSRSAGEYSYPSKFIKNSDITEAKMRASTELDNLVEIGSNHRNKPDGLYGHIHAKAVGGFDYYDTIFKVGNKYYFGIINIMITDRGRLLKDITQIRDISNDIIAQYGENPQGEFVENVSEKSISDFDKNVNSKDSKRLMKKKLDEIKFSLMNNNTFESNVDIVSTMNDADALQNKEEGNFVRVMYGTPTIVRDNVSDAENLDVIISFYSLYLATRKTGIIEGHYHNLGSETIKKLPEYISNPDAINALTIAQGPGIGITCISFSIAFLRTVLNNSRAIPRPLAYSATTSEST